MQEGQHVADLNRPGQNLIFRQESTGIVDDGFEVLAVDEFQHQVRPVLLREIVVDAWDRRMAERGEQVGFALEVLDNRRPHEHVRDRVDHLLDGHQFGDIRKMQVTGSIHRPHSPDTDRFLNVVALGESDSRPQSAS